MVKRNKNIGKLKAGYLFPEINKRKNEFLKKNPEAKLISLGIGDTTEPLSPHIIKGLKDSVGRLSNREGYSGYGDEQGLTALREKISKKVYNEIVSGDEVFISDGAKPDVGRLQFLFGSEVTVAVQDPSYPVYVDSSVMTGQTGEFNEKISGFEGIEYMPCNPENHFFPDLEKVPKTDIIFFCSPNNPTGAVASKEQLKMLVDFARKNKSIIVFDAAYSQFIRSNDIPRSIFEIEGAKEIAIEVNSFSKSVGFTGVRLGWTAVPKELKYEGGIEVKKDWNRLLTTIFNGASNIAQYGGLAALEDNGIKEMEDIVSYYMENAKIIKKALEKLGFKVYGGDNSPYIWARIKGMGSWEAFEHILEKVQVITTPGIGFGAEGEGFVRFSAFGHRENILEAVKRIEEKLK